jgi:hypothetical protein
MLDEKKLLDCTTALLVEHMGVAAQFAAEDALVNMRARSQGDWPDDLLLKMYVVELGKLLPGAVPYVRVRQGIESAMKS